MAEEPLPHKLSLDDRRCLTMTGVTEVVRFDETTVVLATGLGTLVVQGEGLRLRQLTREQGQMSVEGTITALGYQERREPGRWWRRLLG